MTFTKTILSAAALSGLFIATGAASSFADGVKTYKPSQGILFDAGSKHGAGYFLAEAGSCKLVLTLAADPNWDNPEGFTAVRYEATIAPGASKRYEQDGKAFQFGCNAEAKAMTFEPVKSFASAD